MSILSSDVEVVNKSLLTKALERLFSTVIFMLQSATLYVTKLITGPVSTDKVDNLAYLCKDTFVANTHWISNSRNTSRHK